MRTLVKVIPFAPYFWVYDDGTTEEVGKTCLVVAEWTVTKTRSIFISDTETVAKSFCEHGFENSDVENSDIANGFNSGVSLIDSEHPENNAVFFKALAEAQTYL